MIKNRLHKKSSIVVLFAIIFTGTPYAQNFLTGYNSPTEITDDLKAGDIDSVTAELILYLFENPITPNQKTIKRLEVIPEINYTQIQTLKKILKQKKSIKQFKNYNLIKSFITNNKFKNGYIQFRCYPNGKKTNDYYKYSDIYFKNKSWQLKTKGKNDSSNTYFRERYIKYKSKKNEINIGNFHPFFGLGLIAGRSFPQSNNKQENNFIKSFVNPVTSKPDGIQYSYKTTSFNTSYYLLKKGNLDINGGYIKLGKKRRYFGVQFQNMHNIQNTGGLFFELKNNNTTLQGEIAAKTYNKEPAWIISLKNSDTIFTKISLYRYPNGILLPTSSAIHSSSSNLFIMDNNDSLKFLILPEQGIYIQNQWNFFSLKLRAWENPDCSDLKLSVNINESFNIHELYKVKFYQIGKYSDTQNKEYKLGLFANGIRNKKYPQCGIYTKVKNNIYYGYGLWTKVIFSLNPNSYIWVKPSYKNYSSKIWMFYIGEEINFKKNFDFSAQFYFTDKNIKDFKANIKVRSFF